MKGAVEGDDIGAPRIAARELDGVFDRFGARRDQRYFFSPEIGATALSFSQSSTNGA